MEGPSDADRRSHIMEDPETVERVDCWQEVVFDWKVKDFPEIQDRCRSPRFHFCGHTWFLKLYTSHNIELVLFYDDPRPAHDVQISLGIRSASGETEMDATSILPFYGGNGWIHGSSLTFARSHLFRQREELLPLDVLTVTATLKGRIDGTRDVSVQTRVEDIAADDEDEQDEKTGTKRVLQDIGKMWPSDEHSDVVFRVGDVEFKAHRAILSARIPVLGAMFRHDTAEKASGLVTIGDCEPAVFEQLLHYVYRGAPREVTAENACPLFIVTDKYLVSEVKTICVRCMRDTLCVDTFCNVVTLALMHEDELLETAVDFFSRNMLDILQTVQWQTFNHDHSTWANEILIRALKIRPKSFLQEGSLLSDTPWGQRNDPSGADRRPHMMAETGTVERVHFQQTVVFDWKVKDFSELRDGDYYLPSVVSAISPNFHFCGHTWNLQLDTEDWSDSIVLILWSDDQCPAPDIPCTLGIRSASGKTEMEVADTCSFYGEKRSISAAEKEIKKSELFGRREELSPLDVLTVTATLTGKIGANDAALFRDGHDSDADPNFVPTSDDETTSESDESGTPILRDGRDVSVQVGAEGTAGEDGKHEQGGKTVPDTRHVSVQTTVEDMASENEEDEQGEKTGTERVLQDIGKMWPRDEQCDVVFRVGDVEFKAHRAILSARTPALGAMFCHDAAEKASGVVTIGDCEPAVFEQLLHYVYRGVPREVTLENACPLFTVADKYLVSEVKILCVRFMRNTLCVDTFCNTVTLALVHREDELLEAAIDFFSRNMLTILQTVQWQIFNRDHSTWANEIMIRGLKIREEKKPDGDWPRP